ncbi:MAG: hypothetical protein WCK76_01070 [Elusimicrobiota bacterium]
MKDLKDILLMTLISAAVFVGLDNNKRSVPADLRDAVRDTGAAAQAAGNSLADIKPLAAAAAAPVPENHIASDRAAYIKDAEGEDDVVISRIFYDKTLAKEELAREVSRLKTAGNSILFSCLLKETAGGVFYVVRLAPSPESAPRPAASTDKGEEAYVNSLKQVAADAENDCRRILADNR